MAVILGIVILAAVIFWMNRTGAMPGQGHQTSKRKQRSCDWQRVDPNESRALKEYRCSACNDVAYGRGENLPATRPCRVG
ncbi:MAG: hypothetical protein AAF714_11250 [Pseudomonadota bacterium]